MTQQSFTPDGVTALQAELNQLSQDDLQDQANDIRSDFASWLNTNFSFTAAQATYLSGISSEFMVLAAALTAYAVENKLTIALVVDGSPTTFKLVHIDTTITADYSPDGFSTSGQLNYTVTYE